MRELRREKEQIEGEVVELREQMKTADIERKSLRDEIEESRKTIQQLTQQLEETPVSETPMSKTPMSETPMSETPVSETPVSETPIEETPVEQSLDESNRPTEEATESTPLEAPETGIPEDRVDSQIGNNVLLNVLRDTSEESL